MISSLLGFLVLSTAIQVVQANEYTSSDFTAVECKSKNVMDAGYSVRIHHEDKRNLGFICAVSFAGDGHEYFNGPLIIRKMSSKVSAACKLQLTDTTDSARRNLDIRISPNGFGLIMKLEGKVLPDNPDSFTELVCLFDAQFLKDMGCRK